MITERRHEADSRYFESGAISIIGIFPLLAKASSLISAFAIGSAFVSVALLSALSISCSRRLISKDMLLPLGLIVSTTWVIVLDRFMLASFYDLRQIFGVLYSLACG